MKRDIVLQFIILVVSTSISLHASFAGCFIPKVTAYFKDGHNLTGHFNFWLERIQDADPIAYRKYIEEHPVMQKGDNILGLCLPAYKEQEVEVAKEYTDCKYGKFVIFESIDNVMLKDLDSLIYIDTELGAYLNWSVINRQQSALLNKEVVSIQVANSAFTAYKLINTNKEISWQELFLYACFFSDYEYGCYPIDKISWYETANEMVVLQDSLMSSTYNDRDRALSVMIAWTDKAIEALASLKPYVSAFELYTEPQRSEFMDSLNIAITRCKDFNNRLLSIKNETQLKEYSDKIKLRKYWDDYFDVIFPQFPNFGRFEEVESVLGNYLADKGIVLLYYIVD